MSLFRLISCCCWTYRHQSCTFQLLHGHEGLTGRGLDMGNSVVKYISGYFYQCHRYMVAECRTESFISSHVYTHRLSPSIRSVSILISKHLQSMSASLSPLTSSRTELEEGDMFFFRPSIGMMTKAEQPLANTRWKYCELNEVFLVWLFIKWKYEIENNLDGKRKKTNISLKKVK